MTQAALTIAGENLAAIPDERLELLRHTYANGCTPAEFDLFVAAARRLDLDPFARQITLTQRRKKVNGQWVNVAEPVVTIDGFRAVAEKSGSYEGQTPPQWCGPDGHWVDVWLESTPPAAARVGVHRAGWKEPIWGIAQWEAYAATNRDGELTGWWKKGGPHMLAKCAEALALRKAFPNTLGGVYTSDELGAEPAASATVDPAPAPRNTPVHGGDDWQEAPEPAPAPVPNTQTPAAAPGHEAVGRGYADTWHRLVGVLGEAKATEIWKQLELPGGSAPITRKAVKWPTVRELGEALPKWVKLGCIVKVYRRRKADRVPSLPPLHEAKVAELDAEIAEAPLGELSPDEVRLIAKDIKGAARTCQTTVRFPYGAPVTKADVVRTWIDTNPLGGRLLSGPASEPDGTVVFVVHVNQD